MTRSREIRRVFSEGRRLARGALVVIGVSAQSEMAPSRVGLVVGRKYGGAVQRNRIKRQLRNLIRNRPEVVPPGFDFLILPRSTAQSWSFDDLNRALESLISEWMKRER